MTAPVARSPEWLAEHRNGLGGSDIAGVLGVSKFGGPMTVYMDKRGLSAPLVETPVMRWGKLLEEPVAREYEVQSGRRVRRAAEFLRHPKYPWAFANIDRWSVKGGTPMRVLEVKTAGAFAAGDFGEKGSDQVPADYMCQVQWYLFVTERDTADLAALIGGQKFAIYTIERDRVLVEKMLDSAAAFWADTEAGIPPQVDDSDATSAYLRLTYADKGTEREMDAELRDLATEYEGLRLAIKDDEANHTVVGNRIRELMGNDAFAVGDGVKVTYGTTSGGSSVEWLELAKARAIPLSVIDEFTTQKPDYRTLRVTIKD
jgi:putative phage-type endonuclease